MPRDRLAVLSIAAVAAISGLGGLAVPVASAAKRHQPTGVVIGKPTTKPGDKCAKDIAGCTDGKFTGQFFGD